MMHRSPYHSPNDFKKYKNIFKSQGSTSKISTSKQEIGQDKDTKIAKPQPGKTEEVEEKNGKITKAIKSEAGKNAEEVKKNVEGPLSGKPFFTIILLKTHVYHPYQLSIPTSFYRCLPNAVVPAVLACRNRKWEMNYVGNRTIKRFDSGWKQFAIDNELSAGDGCVLELMDDGDVLRFDVRILNGQVPASAIGGASAQAPIVID